MYKRVFKRVIDIILSSIALVVLAIPMVIIAIAVKIDDPGPALFKQKRSGIKKDGHRTCFTMWKFRSMKVNTPEIPTYLLKDPELYITRVGKFIRKTSLDELPQIFQVFTGKLSCVGPRPGIWRGEEKLLEEREKYGANDVRPGITGWAQVNGRDELYIDVKAKLDGEYVDALNAGKFKGFFMDVKCLVKTIPIVLKSEGNIEGGTGYLLNNSEIELEDVISE